MFELKPLSKDSIPEALKKAERYRLLNDPVNAESICRDILRVDPDNRDARVSLILSLTDQFDRQLNETFQEACDLASGLEHDYDSPYYQGLICERRAKLHLERHGPGAGYMAYDWYHKAMESYAKAQEHRPQGNEESILRWNAIVRILRRHPEIVAEPEHHGIEMLDPVPHG